MEEQRSPGPAPDEAPDQPGQSDESTQGADPGADQAPGRGRRVAGATGRVAGATGRGIKRTGQATGSAASYTFRQARRASRAEGAGDSGLYRLIELHAFNAAGDAAVAISLAGTLFFAQPGEARGQVALFLGLTMLPFAVVAPLIGPFLDRFSHGRRWAIGATMALRAFLCWLMADAVASQSLAMFPTALGVLVSSKAYGVARAATVPRLVPEGLTLVKANSRISLAGVVGAAISAPLAGLAATFGSQWSLRYAFVVFAGATILSILLPAKADAQGDELPVSLSGDKRKFRVPPDVVFALRVQRRAADAVGLPDDVHGVPAAPASASGLGAPDHLADGAGDRRRRARQHPRHRARVGAAQDQAQDHGGDRPAGRRHRGHHGGDLLRADPGDRPRTHGRRGPGDGQDRAGLDRAERRTRTPPHLGVRPLGDPAAAVLGDRRVHRDRAAAQDRGQRGSRSWASACWPR